MEPPERFKLPTSWAETRRSEFAELRGRNAPRRRSTDGQIRTDTDQGLGLAPLPVGLRRLEGGVGGSRTLSSDRARVVGWPAAQPLEPTEEESNLRLPGFNRALAPTQLPVEIGEKESNPHFLVQSEVAYLLADPRAKSSCAPRVVTFHSSGYLPAVGRPARRGFLVPLGPVATPQASPGFPGVP